jgi:hypothetical protein
MGDFTGWRGDTGYIYSDYVLQTTNIFINVPGIFNQNYFWNNNHQITTGTQTDFHTCNVVPMVCPWGGSTSARLGNSLPNCHGEELYYTYRVDSANPIFVYAFAPVLCDPNHPDYAQPSFTSYVKDSTGYIIPCTYYRATATNLRGSQQCNQLFSFAVVYRQWQNVAVDLSAYAGGNVTIYFQTLDCGFCGHFGYAYVDVIGCYPKHIQLSDCNPSGAILTAPPGFDRYVWSNGMFTQSVFIPPYVTSVSCTMYTAAGCSITLTASAIFPCPCPSISMIEHN